jgi:hypothetical protein
MVEITTSRCFVLWVLNQRGKVSFEPTVFTSAAAAITCGERMKENKLIKDYNYSVVPEPQIGENAVKPKMHLTDRASEHRVEL